MWDNVPELVVPLLAPQNSIIIGALDVGISVTLAGIKLGVIHRRKKYHQEKCKLIKQYLDKSWHYI